MFSDLADMTAKICTEILGEDFTYVYKGGGSETITAIYIKERDVYETESGIITGVSEVLSAPRSAFSQEPAQGDTLSSVGRSFEVVDVDSDDINVTLYLRLH